MPTLLLLAAFLQADEPSTPRPAPTGLKMTDAGLKGFKAPDGFKAEVAASKLGAVAAFSFDEEGGLLLVRPPAGPATLHVSRVAYKDGSKRDVALLRQAESADVVGGVLGKEVKRRLAANHAGGVLPLGKSLLYCSSGSLLLADDKGKPATLVQGFGAERVRLAIGPDGWLYVAASEGDHFAEGSDGSRATVLRTGAVFRCRTDGSRLHVFAVGFHDPGQPAFDAAGSLFLHDGGVPLEKGHGTGRLLHVPEGADFGYRLAPGAVFDTPDPLRSAWVGDKPGTAGPLVKTAGPASALCIYNEGSLPEAYRGLLLRADPQRRSLRAYRADPDGGSFKIAQEFDLLSGPEGFRPVQAAAGPDGTLYVLDAGTGGRLLRLTWTSDKETEALPLRAVVAWEKKEDADLVKALSEPEAGVREAARRELVRRGGKNRAALLKFLAADSTPATGQLAAMGALQSMADAATLKAFGQVLADGDAEAQAMAAALLGLCAKPDDKTAPDALLRGLGDPDRRVKRASVLAMARADLPGAGESIARLLSFDDEKDALLTQGCLAALDMLGKNGIDALVALADSGNQKDSDRVAAAFPSLRSPAALAAIPALLRNP
ncbi:MAG: hypothetical protein K2W96_07835, partial [Gemmataceae bacterium]|nr:hypothetical protein [Gemmataceae bacterium]